MVIFGKEQIMIWSYRIFYHILNEVSIYVPILCRICEAWWTIKDNRELESIKSESKTIYSCFCKPMLNLRSEPVGVLQS